MIELTFLKELMLIKQANQKSVKFLLLVFCDDVVLEIYFDHKFQTTNLLHTR